MNIVCVCDAHNVYIFVRVCKDARYPFLPPHACPSPLMFLPANPRFVAPFSSSHVLYVTFLSGTVDGRETVINCGGYRGCFPKVSTRCAQVWTRNIARARWLNEYFRERLKQKCCEQLLPIFCPPARLNEWCTHCVIVMFDLFFSPRFSSTGVWV
jgi:hypothetical protein